jgi:hypothetical protein
MVRVRRRERLAGVERAAVPASGSKGAAEARGDCLSAIATLQWHMPALTRQKITFAEMRAAGVRGILIYCADYHCSHSIAIRADQWPDHVRLSDLETRFVCKACGKRGADIRPDFNWNKKPVCTDNLNTGVVVMKSAKDRI